MLCFCCFNVVTLITYYTGKVYPRNAVYLNYVFCSYVYSIQYVYYGVVRHVLRCNEAYTFP